MGDKPVSGQRVTFTLTGTVDYLSPGDLYLDLIGDDGRRHVIERPKSGDYVVEKTMRVGEVWKTGSKMFFVRQWTGHLSSPDGKKVIPAADKGDTYDTQEFLTLFPDAKCLFSP